jgi:hypothetical protein
MILEAHDLAHAGDDARLMLSLQSRRERERREDVLDARDRKHGSKNRQR